MISAPVNAMGWFWAWVNCGYSRREMVAVTQIKNRKRKCFIESLIGLNSGSHCTINFSYLKEAEFTSFFSTDYETALVISST
jgi:hypothetical protein